MGAESMVSSGAGVWAIDPLLGMGSGRNAQQKRGIWLTGA